MSQEMCQLMEVEVKMMQDWDWEGKSVCVTGEQILLSRGILVAKCSNINYIEIKAQNFPKIL